MGKSGKGMQYSSQLRNKNQGNKNSNPILQYKYILSFQLVSTG